MNRWGKILLGISGGLAALVGIGWLGLQIPPRGVPAAVGETQDRGTVEIPADLPPPVRRYLQVAFGEQIPRVETMAAWGRARARFGLWMPLRYQLYHRTGVAFRREMDVTWFGVPILKALDVYNHGEGATGPLNNLETGPRVNQGANLILWAEASFFPSLLVTDPRIRWEPIDETSARLIFPFDEEMDEMIFSFDPETGLLSRTWALRYQGASGEKVPWYAEIVSWQTVDGMQLPKRVAVTWENEGTPWSYWDFDEIRWNVDVSPQLPTAVSASSSLDSGSTAAAGARVP